ncbi:hypothetical protein RhiirB3_161601 [Rhizophagus irregularis]|nr:hypothetical protein RhiirB3_161601 [Rhizophagus irregularis]
MILMRILKIVSYETYRFYFFILFFFNRRLFEFIIYMAIFTDNQIGIFYFLLF